MFKAFQPLKVAVAAATLLASHAAFAAPTFQQGALDLTFTSTAVTLSGLVNLVVTATPGSATTYDAATATASQALTQASLTAAGDVTDFVSKNAGLTFSIGTDKVWFSNFDIDVNTSKLYADVAVSLTGASYQHQALFDIASLTQSTIASNGQTLTKSLTGSGLTLDSAASSTWLATLLAASGVNLNLSTVQFATFSSTVTAAVPEPSTYALMGLGLAAVSLVARRRRTLPQL